MTFNTFQVSVTFIKLKYYFDLIVLTMVRTMQAILLTTKTYKPICL